MIKKVNQLRCRVANQREVIQKYNMGANLDKLNILKLLLIKIVIMVL